MTDRAWSRAGRWAIPMLVLLAAFLQASRVPFRWNQITFAYAAYFREYVRIIELEGPLAIFTTFVGSHPPGYSMLFAAMMAAAAPPIVWMATSGVLSVSAVATIGAATRRVGAPGAAVLAAAVLAVSPYRNAYGLEINNYPMLVGAAGLQWWAFACWLRSEGPGSRPAVLLAGSTALVVWTHALGATLPAAQAAAVLTAGGAGVADRMRRFLVPMGIAAVLCLPLLVGVLSNAEAPPINEPPGVAGAVSAILHGLPGRYGALGATYVLAATALLGGGAAIGSRVLGPRPEGPAAQTLWIAAAAHVVGGLAVIGLLIAGGAAADHQFPYYLVLLPASAMLVGHASELPRIGPVVLVVVAAALCAHGATLAVDSARARRVYRDAAQTHSLVARAVEAWGPGDSLLLVQFPVHGDDDKDYVDAAYSHLKRTNRVHFDDPHVPTQVPADPYFGQPVRVSEGRWLYTFATFDPERFDLIHDTVRNSGHRMIVVQYDTAQQPQDGERLAFWATAKRRRPVRDDNEALWIFLP